MSLITLEDLIANKNFDILYELINQLITNGVPKADILITLVKMAEALAESEVTSSILILDEDGLLRNGASPGLPSDYLTAIDRLKPDEDLGTCASAAATGQLVITQDFFADNKWAELRHWPLSLGFKAAWSLPIKNSKNEVLGTFGTYFRVSRGPTENEIKGKRELAKAAALVLES